jgi:hypothetical protein
MSDSAVASTATSFAVDKAAPVAEPAITDPNKLQAIDLSVLPKRIDPELGEVTVINPNTLARTITIEQAMREFLDNHKEVPRMESEKLERERFIMLNEARHSMSPLVEQALLTAKTEADLRRIRNPTGSNSSKTLADMIDESGGADKMFEENDAEAQRVYKMLIEQGKVLKLPSGAVVSGELTPSAVEGMRKRGIDVGVVIDHTNTPYMQELRKNASTAIAFVHGSFGVTSSVAGVDADSSELVKREAAIAVTAAAEALEKYEKELNIITRRDGDQHLRLRVDIAPYYKQLREAGVPFKDFREKLPLFGEEIRLNMFAISAEVNKMLIFEPCMDTTLYVSRLFCVFHENASLRTVEFSRVLTMFITVFVVLQAHLGDLSVSNAQLEKASKKFRDKAARAGANTKMNPNLDDLPQWAKPMLSREAIESMFSETRALVHEEAMQYFRDGMEWYKRERAYHDNKMSAVDALEFKSHCTRDAVARTPALLEIIYYRMMWRNNTLFANGVVECYERVILAILQLYFPRGTTEWFLSNQQPVAHDACYDRTRDECVAMNDKLTRWRRTATEGAAASEVARAHRERMRAVGIIDPPPLPPNLLDNKVEPDQSWSPTFAQLQTLHDSALTIFNTTPEEFRAFQTAYQADQEEQAKKQQSDEELERARELARIRHEAKYRLDQQQRKFHFMSAQQRAEHNEEKKRNKATSSSSSTKKAKKEGK